jgi:hypothetical protein
MVEGSREHTSSPQQATSVTKRDEDPINLFRSVGATISVK